MALNKPLEMYRSHSNDFYHNDKIGNVENTWEITKSTLVTVTYSV